MYNDFIITGIARVILVGAYEYPETVTSFSGKLSHQELIFNLSGERTVYFGKDVLQEEAGTVRYLPKADAGTYIVDRKTHGECIDIFFDSVTPLSQRPFTRKLPHNKQLASLFKKAFSAWVKHTDSGRLEAISCLYKILAILENEDYIPDKQYKTIKPAIDHINENLFKKKITYGELAACCGISESYLKKLFVQCYKLPPKKYINSLKINYACDLLMEHTYTVTQIAAMTGFENVYYFSRAFKEQLGLTPTDFRKKYISSK